MSPNHPARAIVAAAALIVVVAASGCGPKSTVTAGTPASAASPGAGTTTPTTVAPRCATTVAVPPAGGPAPRARIRSVTFQGSAGAPTVVVVGSGFASVPPPDPPICPAKLGAAYHPGCNTQPSGGSTVDGMDYGPKAVGVAWLAATKEISAGKYVPGVYLDCIGIIIGHWSPTRVVFSFGSQYSLYARAVTGEKYTVQVAGRTRTGVIRYGAAA